MRKKRLFMTVFRTFLSSCFPCKNSDPEKGISTYTAANAVFVFLTTADRIYFYG